MNAYLSSPESNIFAIANNPIMKSVARPARIVESTIAQWYACYTKPRAEKAALQRLREAEIESYLPLQRTRKKWSDRMKWVDEPLLKSYIFVKVNSENFMKVMKIEGLLHFITFENRAVPIPESQINAIRLLLGQGMELEVVSGKIEAGQAIEVQAGPLIGLRGELVEYRGSRKVLVRLGEIGHGILVTISPDFLIRI